jgi:hypothetical protein
LVERALDGSFHSVTVTDEENLRPSPSSALTAPLLGVLSGFLAVFHDSTPAAPSAENDRFASSASAAARAFAFPRCGPAPSSVLCRKAQRAAS